MHIMHIIKQHILLKAEDKNMPDLLSTLIDFV